MKYNRNNNKEYNESQSTIIPGIDNQSDVELLVAQAARGSFEAFGKLYHKYVSNIYQYVFYKVKDKMTAEDITQQVFVKALKAIGTCKGKESTFSPWLYRIAYNQTIDTFRKAKPKLTIKIEISEENRDLVQETHDDLRKQELLEVIDELPQNQKDVIILKFIEGLDNGEIGKVLGKSQGAIRILQMRALSALRSKLESDK